MPEEFLSRFTPSLMSSDALEAVLVKRHSLVDRIVQLACRSHESDSNHHVLLVGPRGIGKTHTVSLAFHRTRRKLGNDENFRIAWLNEEEWGIDSFAELASRILRALEREYGEYRGLTDNLFKSSPDEYGTVVESALAQICESKTVWILAENLDEIFDGLEDLGQKQFRALLQNNKSVSVLATAQSLFAGISKRTSPFYGLFEVHTLDQFTFDEAAQLLGKIALQLGKQELAEVLDMPQGRARVRAVHHLAGGNPRVFVIFSQFLNAESLDELVTPLMQTLDDLTPYYQARMSYLSPQQRKIIEFLCDTKHAISVNEIARRNMLTPQTTSSQLAKLRGLGYVSSTQSGRESLYELREPLMRLSLSVKKMRGGPIRLLLEFLRHWYSYEELSKKLKDLGPDATERMSLYSAFDFLESNAPDPRVEAGLRDYRRAIKNDQYAEGLRVADELIEIRGSQSDHIRRGRCLLSLERPEEALSALERAGSGGEIPGVVDGLIADALVQLERFDDALEHATRAIQHSSPDARRLNLMRKISILSRMGDGENSLKCLDEYSELGEADEFSRGIRPWLLVQAGQFSRALSEIEELRGTELAQWKYADAEAIALAGVGRYSDSVEILRTMEQDSELQPVFRGMIFDIAGETDLSVDAFEKATEADPEDGHAWIGLGIAYYRTGNRRGSLDAMKSAAQLMPESGRVYGNLGVAQACLGLDREAIESFDRAVELEAENWFHVETNRAMTLIWSGAEKEGRDALGRALDRAARENSTDLSDVTVVRNLLLRIDSQRRWDQYSKLLIDEFDARRLSASLGQGLARSARSARDSAAISDGQFRAWRDTWKRHGASVHELDLPIRLLDAVVAAVCDGDVRALMRLPSEERALLHDMGLQLLRDGDPVAHSEA